jgi:hypothetical protein
MAHGSCAGLQLRLLPLRPMAGNSHHAVDVEKCECGCHLEARSVTDQGDIATRTCDNEEINDADASLFRWSVAFDAQGRHGGKGSLFLR